MIIFNDKTISWTHINPTTFKKILTDNNVKFMALKELFYDEFNLLDIEAFDINHQYKTINLHDVCIYNICNELKIFKNELDIKKHFLIVNKWYYFAKQTIDYLDEIFNKKDITGVIVFHGHLMFEACLLSLSKIHNIKFLTLENTSHKERVVWDNISGFVVTYNLSKNYYSKYHSIISPIIIDSYVNNYLEKINDIKRSEHLSNNIKYELPFNKPYILFLGQVYNDASQLFTLGDDFINPIEIIKETQKIAEELGYMFVLKLHPKEISSTDPITRTRYNQPTLRRLKNLEENKFVLIDSNNNFNTFELIKKASIIVTINSQAGIEACLFNKPVFTYFKSFYSNLGFTHDYDDSTTLSCKINSLIKSNNFENKNFIKAKSFFYIFFERYCITRTETSIFNKLFEIFGLIEKPQKNYKIFFKKIRIALHYRFKKLKKIFV